MNAHSIRKVGKFLGWNFYRCTKCWDYFWERQANSLSVPDDCPVE